MNSKKANDFPFAYVFDFKGFEKDFLTSTLPGKSVVKNKVHVRWPAEKVRENNDVKNNA